jgi:hypothetical protein
MRAIFLLCFLFIFETTRTARMNSFDDLPAMIPSSHSLNNPFLNPPHNPWVAQWSRTPSENPDVSERSQLPAMPMYSPLRHQYLPAQADFAPPGIAYPDLPPVLQQVFTPQEYFTYPPILPHAAYSPQQSYSQDYSQQQCLPHHLPHPFVPPRVPEPPRYSALSYAQHYQSQIPPSASQFTPATMGPVPKVFPLSTAAWKDGDKLSREHNNWLEYSTHVENQLGMIPGAVVRSPLPTPGRTAPRKGVGWTGRLS